MAKIKQVIVMRKDLNMRKGKMIAQGAHASLKVFLDKAGLEGNVDYNNKTKEYIIDFKITKDMFAWMIDGRYTKICVGVDSEKELFEITNSALDKNIPYSLIKDIGLTEFNGEPKFTCVAIGPANAKLIDEVTGNLKLL